MSSRFGFEVSAAFEELASPPVHQYSYADGNEIGVLMKCKMPLSSRTHRKVPKPPDLALGFLTSDLFMGHTDLMSEYFSHEDDNVPVMQLPFGGSIFRVATTYILRNHPVPANLHLYLMIGAVDRETEVRTLPGYSLARHRIAVACAQTVLDPLVDGQDRRISMQIMHNFEAWHPQSVNLAAANLQQFHELLQPNPS